MVKAFRARERETQEHMHRDRQCIGNILEQGPSGSKRPRSLLLWSVQERMASGIKMGGSEDNIDRPR